MKVKTIEYFVKEGLASIWSNRIMSLASISTVMASLVIFGMFALITSNLNYIGGQVKEQWQIKVFVDENEPESRLDQIEQEIKNISHVKECILETKEQALENYREQLGEDAHVLEGFDKHNPLRNAFVINLKDDVEDIEVVDEVITQLGAIQGVAKIRNHRESVDKLIKITEFIKMASLWVMGLLTLVAVFIISNTIKLAVFARRKEINIMKFVGATDWFIRWPFIMEGMAIGMIGALLSLVLVGYGYNYTLKLFYQSINIFQLREFSDIVQGLGIIFISLGTSIGAVGSAISIRKYLRV
jgi:cell division transport system permease protein